MIAIVDYGHGNLFSIDQALRKLGVEPYISSDPDTLLTAERVILPGVGAFAPAMDDLRSSDLYDAVLEVANKEVPLLGICLGMQLLAEASEEFGYHNGLGLIPGTVRRLPKGHGGADDVRIPNVGWRNIRTTGTDPQLAEIVHDKMVYFVHSFGLYADDKKHVSATCNVNGADIAVAVRRNNVMGFQFHPEKSGSVGLELIRRFLTLNA